MKICYCDHGHGTFGEMCPSNGFSNCHTCHKGYHLVSGACLTYEEAFCDDIDHFFYEKHEDCEIGGDGSIVLDTNEDSFTWSNTANPIVTDLREVA